MKGLMPINMGLCHARFMPQRYFDTHCHLHDERFGVDLGEVLARARQIGVSRFACCACRESEWETVLSLAGRHEGVMPLLGLHPWYVKETLPGWLERLEYQLANSRAGLGECGLDFAIEDADRQLQQTCFQQQMALAHRLNRPLSIHCRKAWEALISITRTTGLPAAGAVIHAYSGSAEMARELQALGFHLAFGCSLANPANHRAAKAVRVVAGDRLLLETDAPDIPPRSVPGYEGITRNEPVHIHLAAEAAARARGEDLDGLVDQVWQNSLQLFG